MTTTIEYIEEICCSCGTRFQMDESVKQIRMRDGKEFFCPNGHGQFYTKSDKRLLDVANEKIKELEKEALDLKEGNRQLKCELLKFQQEKANAGILKKIGLT